MTVVASHESELEVELTVDAVRAAFRAWLTDNAATMDEFRSITGELDEVFAKLCTLQRLLFNAGWLRLGWPARVSGLGGTILLRGVIVEELAAAGYPPPFSFTAMEVLAPAVVDHATPELSAEMIPRLLRGDDFWCQGFSEPGAGSDLGAISTRAVDDGDNWRVTGQKLWTSWASYSNRCLLIVRTGAQDSAHRGLTALFVDMDTPGLTVRPYVSMTGDAEFAELFFDDAIVPKSRTLGVVDGGWNVAMSILGYERGAAAWQRQAWMMARLNDLLRAGKPSARSVGETYEMIHALRLSSRRTMRVLGGGAPAGPAASIDKLMLSTAEQSLFDLALATVPDVLFADDAETQNWRRDILYSRAASIYGGAAEVQRNIIAQRLLNLPRAR
ncbi:MAG: putative acyl-CoA dehydrogenase [Frankiales bacterium]|nr:putative acyl-CoA dehydrogenase [Frankiales bacterium]